VRPALRHCFFAVPIVILAGTSLWASPPNPVSAPFGEILHASRERSGLETTYNGVTIYDGDRLETQSDETLWARLHNSQLNVMPNTLTEIHGLPNGFSAVLMRGTVIVSSLETQAFQLLADGITIRPLGAQGSVAQVTLVNSSELEVTSPSGGIQLSMGDEIETVMPDKSYRIEIEPDKPEPQGNAGSGQGTAPTGKSHFTKYLIVGVAVATAIGIWRAVVSPCAP
jgi:hypothetical protein